MRGAELHSAWGWLSQKEGRLCHFRKAVSGLRALAALWVSWRTSPRKMLEHRTPGVQPSGQWPEVLVWGLTSDLGLFLPVGTRIGPQGSPGCLTLHPLFRKALPSQPCTLALSAPARRGRSTPCLVAVTPSCSCYFSSFHSLSACWASHTTTEGVLLIPVVRGK